MVKIYSTLLENYGHRNWWPADSAFEVVVGAVLTQNTTWRNVEKALHSLKERTTLTAENILLLGEGRLGEAIRSAGFYNVKAKRLSNVCEWLISQGGISRIKARPLNELRTSLLTVNGVGMETADDILLYALDKPVFVIDAYTRRIFSRLGWVEKTWGYERLRAFFEQTLGNASIGLSKVQLFNEYHALIVKHASVVCKSKPLCQKCCLSLCCDYVKGT